MAVIWSKQSNGKQYEVRAAGRARRLYTDGVLHSAYHPDKPLTGSVWDLLLLPALFYPLNTFKRVLVLGAGAGSILHLLNRHLNPEWITAIEIDEVHLGVAKRFFKSNYANVHFVKDDAVAWVQNYTGEPFDLVIEDLFVEIDGLPVRLMHDDVSWLDGMLALLTQNGLLVMNHGDAKEAHFTRAHLTRKKMLRQFTMPLLHNRILAFPATAKQSHCYQENMNELKLSKATSSFSHRLMQTGS